MTVNDLGLQTLNELVRELRGTTCRCGERKVRGETFCSACYFSLPKDIRIRLIKRFGDGYEQAYASACNVLDKSSVEGSGT